MTALRALSPDELAVRLYQQELVASFGIYALSSLDLPVLLEEACKLAAQGLQAGLTKVLKHRPETNDLLVVAGIGWHEGVVGHATLSAGEDSPAGYALLSRQPVLSNMLGQEKRFRMPKLLADHGAQSAINVVIGLPAGEPFGVLEADSTHRHEFGQADTIFLQSLANVLAATMVRAEAERLKDELLRGKDLMMQEVHHRVRNSLQLVHTLLQLQSKTASGEAKLHLDGAAGRIMTIGAVHHRLYSGSSVGDADATEFLRVLLNDMRPMLADAIHGRKLTLHAPPLRLVADAITPLGLIVSELVTNAAKYGKGEVRVTVAQDAAGLLVTVEDEGPGFPADFEPRSSSGLGMRLVQALSKSGQNAVQLDRSVPHARVTVLLKR